MTNSCNNSFSKLNSHINDRVSDAKNMLHLIKKLESDSLPYSINLKGYIFVSLYSVIEYSLTSSVSKFLELLKNENHHISEYKQNLLAILLDSEFNSLRDCSKKKIWEKRFSLVDSMFNTNKTHTLKIDDSVFPTQSIANIGSKEILDIWNAFNLPDSPFKSKKDEFLLDEIKDKRNAIAHGRECSNFIGGRFTSNDLSKKLDRVQEICEVVTSSFVTLYNSKGYLNDQSQKTAKCLYP